MNTPIKSVLFGLCFAMFAQLSWSQEKKFTVIKRNPATSVKDQGLSGTCWCFSSTALVESELLFKLQPETDLSETFTVYHLYLDKAEKYIRRRGDTRFTEGGLQQDMLYAISVFGAMPQEIYPGIGKDAVMSRNYTMAEKLKAYLDKVLKNNPDTIPASWKTGFTKILSSYLGTPPATFTYNGKEYTPKTFAAEQVNMKLSDFIGLTSFTHHPWYSAFAIEVPDNYNSNMYYNVTLDDLFATVKAAIAAGYTVAWDADVTNGGFQPQKGVAMWAANDENTKALPNFTEQPYSAEIRQQLFDRQVTQDDHLMQITGLAKDENGTEYFLVKNSYGTKAGPYNGYIYVSMPYFAINTISIVVNKKLCRPV